MKNSIELLRATIEMKQQESYKLQVQCTDKQHQQLSIEIDPDDYSSEYDDALDESGDVTIAGYNFAPSYALKQLDEFAYREGLLDYVDANYSTGDTDEYKALEEEINFLIDQIGDLSYEIDELENQIADLTE